MFIHKRGNNSFSQVYTYDRGINENRPNRGFYNFLSSRKHGPLLLTQDTNQPNRLFDPFPPSYIIMNTLRKTVPLQHLRGPFGLFSPCGLWRGLFGAGVCWWAELRILGGEAWDARIADWSDGMEISNTKPDDRAETVGFEYGEKDPISSEERQVAAWS